MRLWNAPALVLAATAGAAASTTPLDVEADLPQRSDSAWAIGRGISAAVRKDDAPSDDANEAGPAVTFGTLFNLHTGELLALSETEPSADAFSTLLEDRGLAARIDVDPRLLAMLRGFAAAHPGVRIDVVSGYRSAKRNEMMRKKGHHVASHSQHTLGRAVDFRVEGLTVADISKELEAKKWDGGLGRYPFGGDLFVHADVGPNRRWLGR